LGSVQSVAAFAGNGDVQGPHDDCRRTLVKFLGVLADFSMISLTCPTVTPRGKQKAFCASSNSPSMTPRIYKVFRVGWLTHASQLRELISLAHAETK